MSRSEESPRDLAAAVTLRHETAMTNRFDPYREALVIEARTLWTAEAFARVADPRRREWIERRLHGEPAGAEQLEYVRLTTGFIRQITVTPSDLDRLAGQPSAEGSPP